MSDLKTISLFDTFVYQTHIPKYLEDKDFMVACNEHTDKAINEAKESIEDRHKLFNADIKDHGMSYHSGPELYKEDRLGEFELLIRNTGKNILEDQGFDLSNHIIDYTEMWIQKFASQGGGQPGTLLLFNSWLPHQFSVDNGVDPFRFIHFNLQARKK